MYLRTHVYMWGGVCMYQHKVTATSSFSFCLAYQRPTWTKCVCAVIWVQELTTSHLSIIQPIADKVAQHLEIISKSLHFCTRRSRIGTNRKSEGPWAEIQVLVRLKSFRNNIEMLCHPIFNWLYVTHSLRKNWKAWDICIHTHANVPICIQTIKVQHIRTSLMIAYCWTFTESYKYAYTHNYMQTHTHTNTHKHTLSL